MLTSQPSFLVDLVNALPAGAIHESAVNQHDAHTVFLAMMISVRRAPGPAARREGEVVTPLSRVRQKSDPLAPDRIAKSRAIVGNGLATQPPRGGVHGRPRAAWLTDWVLSDGYDSIRNAACPHYPHPSMQ